jgi:hypothetical protein
MCDRRVTRRALFTRKVIIRRRAFLARGYNGHMDERRTTYGATIRLALIFSTAAALAAIALQSIGHVSTTRLVIAVAVVGFVTSWVQTGRLARTAPSAYSVRSTLTT